MRHSVITDLLKTLYLTSQRGRGSYCASSHEEKTMSSRDIMGIKKLIPLSDEKITASYTETNRS